MKPIKLCVGQLLVRTSPNDDETLNQQVQWLNDPEVVKYSEQRHHIHTLESQRRYYNLFTGSNLFLALYIGSDMIGTMTVYTDDYNNVADVGIMIGNRDFWFMGHGNTAWKLVCDHLFKTGTRKIEAGCMEDNFAMTQICSRYQMNIEAYQKGHFLFNGRPVDLLRWGRFK